MMPAAAADTTLEVTRIFEAPCARVFDAWLEQEQWQSWIGPEGITCEIPQLEPRVGGHYRINMRMSTGQLVAVTGTFQTIDRPRLLVLTWGWDGDPSRQSLLTLTFTDKGGKTELTLRQEGLGSRSNRDDHGRGWGSTLNKLQAYLAASAASTS
jgi:uncharacterized protein YndB with AHSA1/START domain